MAEKVLERVSGNWELAMNNGRWMRCSPCRGSSAGKAQQGGRTSDKEQQ